MTLRSADFESAASASSAIPAWVGYCMESIAQAYVRRYSRLPIATRRQSGWRIVHHELRLRLSIVTGSVLRGTIIFLAGLEG